MNTGFLVSVDLSEGGPPRLGQQLVHLFSFLNMPLLLLSAGASPFCKRNALLLVRSSW